MLGDCPAVAHCFFLEKILIPLNERFGITGHQILNAFQCTLPTEIGTVRTLTTKHRHNVRYLITIPRAKSTGTELKYKFIMLLITYTIPPVGAIANVFDCRADFASTESVSTITLLIPTSPAVRTLSKQATVQREKYRADENSFLHRP